MGYWSIVVPEATKNYIPNPSLEVDTTGYTNYATGTASGTRARSQAWQKRDAWSYRIQKTAGGASDEYGVEVPVTALSEFVAGDYVTFSCDLKIASGTVRIKIEVVAGTTITQTADKTADGRYNVTVGPIVGAVTSVKAYAYIITATGDFYLDGLQVERKSYATTYCDGTREGCSWAGAAHNSASSRLATSRAGGRELNLDSYQAFVKETPGIGFPPIQHLTHPQALLPGDLYRGYKVTSRAFTLSLNLHGTSQENRHSIRQDFIDAIKPDLGAGTSEPFLLRYAGANASKAAEIAVVYDSGLEYGHLDGFEELVDLRVIAYDPLWREDGDVAAALTPNQSVSNANGIVGVENGIVTALGTGVDNGAVWTIAVHPTNGKVYVGGTFTSMAGGANTKFIAVWDPVTDTWAAVGTGAGVSGSYVRQLVFDAQGNLYAAGLFFDMGGVALADHLAKWDGSAWSALTPSGAINGGVNSVAIAPNGTIYATGYFTSIDAVTVACIAQRNPSTGAWSGLGTGLAYSGTPVGWDLAVAQDGRLYVVGVFTTANGVSCAHIAVWNGATFAPLGSGIGGSPGTGEDGKLLVRANGNLVLGYKSTQVGGVSGTGYIAEWNGTAWLPLGSGVNSAVYEVDEAPDRSVVAGGNFTLAGGLSVADRIARWNDSIWTQLDIDLPGSPIVRGLAYVDDLNFYVGFDTSGSASASAKTTVNNASTRAAYPKLVIKRSGGTTAVAQMIRNLTTGKQLLLNYALQDGETLTIDLTPGARSCVSSLYGSVWRAILQSSDVADFALTPGSNDLSVYVSTSGSPTITAYAQWRNTHWSADGVAA